MSVVMKINTEASIFIFNGITFIVAFLLNKSISLSKIHIVNGFCVKLEMANWKPYT